MSILAHFRENVRNEADLLRLEMRIARRADEVAKMRGTFGRQADDWDCWFEAEQEVLTDAPEPAVR